MCGRFTITADRVEFILKKFQAAAAPGFGGLTPRYNAAPGQFVPAIVAKEDGGRFLTEAFWGFVPPWGEAKGDEGYQINIRDDTIGRNSLFRARLLSSRCILLADGFYEWKKPSGFENLPRGARLPRGVRKIPHRIVLRDREVFPMAALWRTRVMEEKSVLTAGIITTAANDEVAPIHDRMPVILEEADLALWLDPKAADFGALHRLLDPYPPGRMEAYPVSEAVNSARNDVIACIEPLGSVPPRPRA